jgi:HSP20 family molecular chaperone IbpA
MQESSTTSVAKSTETKQEQSPITPAVDVFEDSSGITLCADLPGVPKENLVLQINGDALTIEGDIALETPADMEVVHAEVRLPRYQRVFTLSKELDTDHVDAKFEAGVLTVRIPKAEHAQPKRINVQIS